MKLSIIMPMYNARDIKKNVDAAMHSLNKFTKDFEIILVDDGSSNDCLNQAKKIRNSRLKVVGYKENQGKGNAIKYGFQFCSGEYVAFVDSGRDLDPVQLNTFMKVMQIENADIVVGSKRHPDSKVHYPLLRRFMSWSYQIINHVLFDLSVKDTQVGIKLFKKSALDKIMPKIAIKRFAFDLELLVIAQKLGYKIVEAPIKMRYQFGSSINSKAVFWMLWDTSAIFYRNSILHYYD